MGAFKERGARGRVARAVAAIGVMTLIAGAARAQPGRAHGGAPGSATDAMQTRFGASRDDLEAWRIFTGTDGESHLEKVRFKGQKIPFFDDKTGLFHAGISVPKSAVSFLSGRLARINIYSAPGDVELPSHLSPGSEMFLILRGSATLVLRSGQTQAFGPGDLVIFEDTKGHGRQGRTGPEGFTAVNFSFVTQGPISDLAEPAP